MSKPRTDKSASVGSIKRNASQPRASKQAPMKAIGSKAKVLSLKWTATRNGTKRYGCK